jgi:enoyl-CoA hydratase/3-hydroxyacyl-CoA dehydrogenase
LVPDIKKVAVIGAGEMGHGIAQLFAMKGYQVVLSDKYPDALSRAKERIEGSMQRMVQKGRLTQQEANESFSRITFAEKLSGGDEAPQLAIEAVPENIELKKSVFAELDSLMPQESILCSNTSNIRISEIAAATRRPERVAGLHFFNPPTTMKLVEVIPSAVTSKEVVRTLEELCRSIGKTPVKVLKDSPGFIVNRINAADILFFSLVTDKGIASPAEVDAYAKTQGLPMGPYELLDFVGLDIAYDSLLYFSRVLSPDYSKVEVLRRLVEEKKLGRKTGQGFYKWVDGRAQIPVANPTDKVSMLDLFAIEINEAVKLIEEGVAGPKDVETGVVLGMNRPFGPISVAKSFTSSEISAKLEELASKFGCEVFEPARSIREGRLRELIEGQPAEPKEGQKAEPTLGAGLSAEGPLTVEKLGEGVARLTLNRQKQNAINSELLDSLERELDRLRDDRGVRVLLITGKGANLSAGADVSQFFAGPMDFIEFSKKGQRVFRKLSELPQLTIAVMKGNVLGGGLELALSCDLRIVSQEAVIGFPEVTLGLVPGWSGTQRLPKLIGASRAAQLILTGGRITGKEAYEFGLAHTLVQTGDVDEFSVDYARKLCETVAPVAVALAKKLLKGGAELPLEQGLEMEALGMGVIFGTEDLREGVSAFFQKRKPSFKGR